MEKLSNLVSYVNNLPPAKKLILLIIVIILVVGLVDFIGKSMKSNYRNVTNHSIENMEDGVVDPSTIVSTEDNHNNNTAVSTESAPNMLPFRDVMMNTEILNITLFYADWCGHCKKFMGDTWGQLKEKFGSSDAVQLNQIDCTSVKSAIETPAGKSIEGFPTLILNYKDKSGKYIEEEYNGPRSFQVIASVIDKFTN
jgi:thiol-disulfide isomerase/thioredoxin